MNVILAPIGNQVTLEVIGNQIEVTTFDVFTDRTFISQFQIHEKHKEVHHETYT